MNQCALCGLPTGRHPISQCFRGEERQFCCAGCMNVFAILLESGIVADGVDLRNTELFRESLRLGLVSQTAPIEAAIPTDAETREALFQISGMWCASCGWLIERALAAVPGVVSAEVMFAADILKVRYCPQFSPPGRVQERVTALGYRAAEFHGETGVDPSARRDLLLRLGVAFFLWMNVMTLSLVVYASYWEAISDAARQIVPFVLMALATPAVLYSGWPILRGAALGLRSGALRMEVLVALGISAAYTYSAIQALSGGTHYYFDTACAIITLVLLGQVLERGAKERTAQSIAFLYRMMPRKARLFCGGEERWVSIDALEPGMPFLVKAGERVPADGIVMSGESQADESVVTGESALVRKRREDEVIGGTVNTDGVLVVRATRVREDSTLSHIIRSVQNAISSRAPLERMVDRVARIFVPAVAVLSGLTLLGAVVTGVPLESALMRAIAVLVIACPCALGIATPLAITAAVGACSRRGVLISDSRVLEATGKVDVVVFDKTGTITEGIFGVTTVVLSPVLASTAHGGPSSEDGNPLALVGALEACSEHPAGCAIARYARSHVGDLPPAREVAIKKGMGISGSVGDLLVFAGNRRMMEANGAMVEPSLEAEAAVAEANGRTVVFFGWDGAVAGFFAMGDRIRAEAHSVIGWLRRRGISVSLVSGDSGATTARVASALGFDDYHAEVLPEGKLDIIRRYQQAGRIVAMIGDGINDAPALAAADLGIAMGSGTDLAMQAAPVVLMSRGLDRVGLVFEASGKALRIIRQNLFWAFFYNTLGISLAVAGVLNPILAAGAMVLSSLSVIGNSLRLKRLL